MRRYFSIFKGLKFTGPRVLAMPHCLLMGLVIFVMLLWSETGFSQDKPLIKTHIDVALIRSAFVGSNESDAAAAFKTLAKIIGEQKGYDIVMIVSIFDDSDELSALPEEKRPHIALWASWSFLQIEKEGWLTPVATISIGNAKACSAFEILVPDNSQVETIEGLRGKTLNILLMPQTQIGFPWLQSLLQERSLGTMESFFKKINIENDPMKTVLPVFFGQRDAGLIPAEKFQLMAELNPQLNRMHAIAVSEPLICSIISVNNIKWTSNATMRKDFIDAMLNLHLSPAGQQILHLFKTDQILAYRPEDMNTIRELAKILSGATH